MILFHIINDEKFINATITQFGHAENQESYYLLPITSISQSKYLRKDLRVHPNIKCYPYHSKAYFDCIHKINPDFLIIHGLSIRHKFILKKLKNKYKIVWSSWGRDIFSMNRLKHRMYKPKTNTLVKKIEKSNLSLKKRCGKVFYWFLNQDKRISNDTFYYLKYINFMSTVVKEDYEALVSHYPSAARIKYINFNYGVVRFDKTEFTHGKNIIIGNSANPENNHLESFLLLKPLEIENREVIVPLSYGGNPFYINEISKKGKKIIGENFNPLYSFLKKEEYESLLDSVGFAIMNQSHQHAMGNIIYLLSNGVKIYMDFNNTAAKYLQKLGIKIYSVNDEISFSPLKESEKINNRSILINHFGSNAIKKRTQSFVDELSHYLLKD